MFFSYLGLTEGKSPSQIVTKIKNDLQTAVMGSWAVWIPAHAINFRFVPTSQRLLYINTIQIGYNVSSLLLLKLLLEMNLRYAYTSSIPSLQVFLSFIGNKTVSDVEKPAGDVEPVCEEDKEKRD